MTIEMKIEAKDAVELVLRNSRTNDPADYRNLPLSIAEIERLVRAYLQGSLDSGRIRVICEALAEEGRAHLASDNPLAYCWGGR
jgi:hypothetical protein